MDNKPIEKLGEAFIKSRLLKYEFDTHSDLSYDESGTDLIITQKLDFNTLHYIKIQCKGRRIKKTTNVRIPISYVNENFVVFVYLIDENKNEYLFCFFDEDVKALFNKKEVEFIYSFSLSKIDILKDEFSFNEEKATRLKLLFDKFKRKNFTSIIIGGIFLIESIRETKKFYSDYWKKELSKPKLHEIVKNIILRYSRFDQNENDIACYLNISNFHALEDQLIIENKHNNFVLQNTTSVKTFVSYSNEIVAFQIMDDIDRFKKSNNIILVANDIVYEKFLNELRKDVDDIIIMRLKINERPNEMYVDYRWGNISDPIGLSMGL